MKRLGPEFWMTPERRTTMLCYICYARLRAAKTLGVVTQKVVNGQARKANKRGKNRGPNW